MSRMVAVEVGQRYGHLTVTGPSTRRHAGGQMRTVYPCRCDCGATLYRRGSELRSPRVHSCGCGERAGALAGVPAVQVLQALRCVIRGLDDARALGDEIASISDRLTLDRALAAVEAALTPALADGLAAVQALRAEREEGAA